MISDRYTTLYQRVVTQVPDGAGGFTETTADTAFQGYIAELSGQEVLKNNQIGVQATAQLFTKATLSLRDRVVDGSTEYEVVWAYSKFHLRYMLKQIKMT